MTHRTTCAALLFGVAVLLPATATSQYRYGLTENEYRAVEEARRFFNDLPASDRGGVELPETDELIRCMLSDGQPCRRSAADQRFFERLFGRDGVVGSAVATAPQQSERYLSYGSRGAERVRIVNETGIDSAYAAIELRPDFESARLHCEGYLNDMSDRCPADIVAEFAGSQFLGRVTGNCESGEFTSMFGDRYRYEGPEEQPSARSAEYRLRDLASSEVIGPGDASGYPVLIETFGAMCPASLSAVPASRAGPPPSDAVYDTRAACLYGEMEGEKVTASDRIAACDALASLEAQALDAGYCWNQMAGEYMACRP